MDSNEVIEAYQSALEQFEQIKIRRYGPLNKVFFEVKAWARPVGILAKRGGADALIGTITEGFATLIISALDLRNAKFPLPMTTNDKVLIKNANEIGAWREYAITTVDAGTRRVGGVLVAYEVVIKGQI